ncbi:ZIP family metal transporter [Piscirickettsia litoralis]|uniref:ZIP family metal transporter n=1 Tax=Piscirickettsia litoralis TaxID=1891921 RepID=UPI000B147401|nr:ZIP family metal transporter [Piscirickettsia litoralis]
MLIIHSLLEGTALGLSGSFSLFAVILFAILAHKWAASFALAIQLSKSHLKMKYSLSLFLFFALMTPLGILFGDVISSKLSHIHSLEPIFSSLAAGTFLYLGTLHGLNRAVLIEKCCNLKHYSYVVLGFALMAVVAIWT